MLPSMQHLEDSVDGRSEDDFDGYFSSRYVVCTFYVMHELMFDDGAVDWHLTSDIFGTIHAVG